MKEKQEEDDNKTNLNDQSLDDNNILNIDTSTNSKSKDILINVEGEDKKEEKSIDLSEINLAEAELGSKIRCPEPDCFLNPIILIDPISFKVNCDCGKHKRKLDIIEYALKSGKVKDNKEKCFKCEKTYEDLKKKKIKLYKCYCEKFFCKECKVHHINEFDDNKDMHNMIDFTKKDYYCCCSKKNKNYIGFCIDCKKNICQICIENHKDHNKKNFSELNILDTKQKKSIKEKIAEQTKKIAKISKILDDWLERAKNSINIYKKQLDLYNKLNSIMINQYSLNKCCYETIKNAEYIGLDLDENFSGLLEAEKDYQKQNLIIFQLLTRNRKLDKKNKSQNKENGLIKLEIKYNQKMSGQVNNICELTKEELVIINILRESKEEINIYKKIENGLEFLFSVTEDNETLNLMELKNGNLLILKKHQIKIYNIDKNQKSINKIQEIKTSDYPNEYFKEIKELTNGYLISISSYNNKIRKNKISFWEKKLINREYEIIDSNDKNKENPIHILEINDKNYLIIFENNEIYIYDSNPKEGGKKYVFTIKNQSVCERMIQVENEGILLIFLNTIYLLNIKTLRRASTIKRFLFNDICCIDNFKKNFLISYTNNMDYGLLLLNSDLNKNELFEIKEIINDNSNYGINCMKLLSNGDIITASNDKTVKIFKILKKIWVNLH